MKISEIRQQYPQYDGLSDKQLADALHAKFYPDMPLPDFYARVGLPTKEDGIGSSFARGAESAASQARTGLASLVGGNEAALAGLERGEAIQQKYPGQRGFEEVEKAYKERGVLPAVGEYISQIPSALAEQAPQIAASVAGARLGGVGGVPGAVIGAATPSYLQQYGGFLERQAEEQKKRGEPVDVNRGTAALAAIPAAALDVAATFIPMGRSIAGKVFGPGVEKMLAKGAEQQAEKLAQESIGKTLAKGTAVGIAAELPTEITQAMIERAQAGLSLTSDDALAEYGKTAFEVSKLAPLGTAGRYVDRAAARSGIERKQEAERQAEQLRILQEEDQRKAEEERLAAEAEAAKTGTPPLLAGMGDTTLAGEYSLLKDPVQKRLDALNKIASDMGYTQEELKDKTPDELHQMLTTKATVDLQTNDRVIPAMQQQIEAAREKGDWDTVQRLAKQLEPMGPADEALKKTLKDLNKLAPKEVDFDSVSNALKKAVAENDYAKAAQLAEVLKGAPPKEKTPVQEDMFAPGYEKRAIQRDIAEIEEGFGAPPAREQKPSKAEQQQTALFEQSQEMEDVLDERELGKSFELTPEQYADALRKGYNPAEVGQAPKVLYRKVDTKTGTQRIPYVIDANGMARDITDAEAAKLESAQAEETPVTKMAVSEAIDSGLITPAVKQQLGLSNLGRSVLNLSNPEDAAFAEAALRNKLEEHKAASQEVLKRFIDDPFAENTLYDMQGKLTDEAKNIIRGDVQAQEIERLLNHIVEQQKGARATLREDQAAKELTKTLHRKEAVDTKLPPIESLSAQDQSELNKALGVTGVAEGKTLPKEKVDPVRHRLEAKRQGILRQEAYEKLLQRLQTLKESGDKEIGQYATKMLQRIRAEYVDAALKEAAHLRAADRRPGLTASEVMESSSELHTALRELSTRYLAKAPTREQTAKVPGMTYKAAVEGKPVEDTTVTEGGEFLYSEKYTELTPKGEKQQARIVGKLKSKQAALSRAVTTYNNHKTNFLDPAYKAYQEAPEGPLRTAAHNKYIALKKQSDANDARVRDLTSNLLIALRDAGKPKATEATIEQDIRDLTERPFGKLGPALEAVKEHLDEVSARLIGEAPGKQRVAVSPIARAQDILDRIKTAEKELEAIKGKHKQQAEQQRLRERIESLRKQYDDLMAQKGEAPAAVTNFAERRDEMQALQDSTKALFAKGDYEAAAKGLERLRQLNLDEQDANVLGAELERNDRVLERAMKDTQKQLEELATGLTIAEPKEVKLGARVPPRVALNAEQVAQYKQLTKQLDALERAYVNNKGAMESVGLYSGNIDTLTEDMFGAAPELGVVFETPEKFLGSAKYGKIAKLRKAASQTADVMPVSTSELYAARSEYVAATNVLAALRKLKTKTPPVSTYYQLMSGEYLRQAEAVRERNESQSDASKSGWEGRKWLEKEEKRLRALAEEAEARAKFFLHTLTEQQAATLQEFNEAAKEVEMATADGMVTAQAAADRAKEKMDAVDARAVKNGVLAPAPKQTIEEVTKTVDEKLNERLADTYKQINDLKAYLKTEPPWDLAAATEAELMALHGAVRDIETEMYMRTAEGKIKRLTESFLEEFSSEYDAANPLKNALGRARARSQEYVPQSAQVHVERIEQLRKDRGEVVDAMAKLAKATPPTNKQAFIEFNEDVYELREKLEQIDSDIEELTGRIQEAQNGEVQMLMRADSAVKDAWAKLKAAEAAIKAGDRKAQMDMAKRKAALLEAEKVVNEAKQAARLQEAEQKQRLSEGLGLPGIRVSKVAALSQEGENLAARKEGRKIQTMNPGWSVTYTTDGPQFSYDPAQDPDATEGDKKRKAVTANKAYDQLKKARSAYNRALDSKNATAIEATQQNLKEKERLLEELAGARYIRVVEAIDADPIELDASAAVHEAVLALPAKDKTAYLKARAAQEAAKKQLEHIRSLKGETELTNVQKAARKIDEDLKQAELDRNEIQFNYDYDLITKNTYENRIDKANKEVASLQKRKADIQQQLGPREKTHEAKLQKATQDYFAAKKKADDFILPKKEEQKEAKGTRAPATENLADLTKTLNTLAYQSKVSQDVKPLNKQNVKLRSASTQANDARLRKSAEKMAKADRLVTMYKQGSLEYNNALKEVTEGYFNKIVDSKAAVDGGTAFRIEDGKVTTQVDPVAASNAAKQFAAKLPKDVKFVYAPTLRQAPLKFLRALADDDIDVSNSAVKGGVMPDGTIVIIGDMHSSLKDLEETLVHETIGHYGVDIVLGPDGMAQLVKAIRTSEGGIIGMAKALGTESDVAATAQAWENKALAAEAEGKPEEAKRLRRMGEVQAVREMLATLQERTVDQSFIDKVGNYIKAILGAMRSWLKSVGLLNTASVSSSDLYYTLFKATNKMRQETAGTYMSPSGLLAMRNSSIVYANGMLAEAGRTADALIAKQKPIYQSVLANGSGLAFETQVVDRFAGFERMSKTMEPLRGAQMMYYLRMYDQRMNFTAQAVGNGALTLRDIKRADGRTEHIIESEKGPCPASVVNILKDAPAGSPAAAQRLFTLYMSAIRAKDKGIDALNFGGQVTQAHLNQAMQAVEATPGLKENFEKARAEYNTYNRNMIKLLERTGVITPEVSAELTKNNDYIPWYRERNGVAELVIGKESPIRIGSIAEQPYLHELVGGDRPILDFLTSSVQNTNMITEMALNNMATKNAGFELERMGMAQFVGATSGPNIIKFKMDGVDKFMHVQGTRELPGDLLVKGMQGIPTQMPAVFRLMGIPARVLRKAVTALPLYGAKQLFRDSLAAPILAGADFTPVMGALKEIGSPRKGTLESRGITGGQIFTGTTEDLSLILKRISEGKAGWATSLAKWEAVAMEADAITRRAQYNSYIRQGLSEMEATLMTLESMNFNKRGASPSMHIISSLIPFFNAQIQSLNVLYKALFGKMPFNEKLKIQEKLLQRGALLAASTLAYTAMMQDDEAYKNATPDQKYGNWFIRIPGVEEPVRLPIPFEIGYIFKALPEALYNTLMTKHGGEDAAEAFQHILLQTIPGGSSYGLPQAIKPYVEAKLGKSFYTGRDTLSQHEKTLLPEQQFRENTTEAAKMLGKLGNVSPIVLEQLVQGYTGGMGLLFLQAISTGISKGESPEKAVQRLSDMPVIGGAFQPNDAGYIANKTYDRMVEIQKVQNTVDDMLTKGQRSEAMALLQKRGNEYAASELADYYVSTIKEITQYENAIRASNLTPEEKRQKLTEARRLKTQFASDARAVADKTIPQ